MENNEFYKGFWKKSKTRKARHFNFWLDKLTLIATSVFKWENLPPNLPYWEIEKRLIFSGRCFVFQTKDYGVVTSFGATSGVDIYNNANLFNYAQAVLKSKSGLRNNIDGVIMYGSSLDKVYGASGVIGRKLIYYADALSDISVSRQVGLINNRSITAVSVKSDNAVNALSDFYTKLTDGELTVPKISSGVFEATENILKEAGRVQGYSLNDFSVAEENLLKQFYSDFGITYAMEKRERMITDEVIAEKDSLDINVYDMLQCRRDGANAINSLFGTCIEVGVNNDNVTN